MGESTDAPHNRLFILCSKSTTYEDLREAFEKYGNIEDIWIVKDKVSGDPKGVVYITFTKTSSAALAAEEMHGVALDSSPKPLKIMVAHSRAQGSIKKEDDHERLVRLFIVVPKSATEEEIRNVFSEWGKIESINIVKNRETGENKGFAYVRYLRPYSAAKAFEECPQSYRAVFAKPREQKPTHVQQMDNYDRYGGPMSGGGPNSYGGMGGGDMGMGGGGNTMWMGGNPFMDSDRMGGGGGGGGNCRLVALVSPVLRENAIFRLFDLIPGLQMCRLVHEARSQYGGGGQQKVLLQYSTSGAAQHVLEKMNAFEYPPGHRIVVKPADGGSSMMGGGGGGPMMANCPNKMGGNFNQGSTTISNNELATLQSALAKAESIIKAAGLSYGSGGGSGGGNSEMHDSSYCSVSLPSPKPLVSKSLADSDNGERLFIVCQPGLPPMYALRDVFGRFGDLIEVYVINGKNCGYVSYASKEAAEKAIETLHLQEVCGMRLKVMKAEPPRGGPNDRKRVRVDTDDS